MSKESKTEVSYPLPTRREKRLAALESFSQREEEKRKKFGAEKHELKRFAVQKQMDRDEVDRRRITDIVETTKAEVMQDLDEWEKARRYDLGNKYRATCCVTFKPFPMS